jgi:hypothetical protein
MVVMNYQMKNKILNKISYNAQAKCQKLDSFFGNLNPTEEKEE